MDELSVEDPLDRGCNLTKPLEWTTVCAVLFNASGRLARSMFQEKAEISVQELYLRKDRTECTVQLENFEVLAKCQ